MKSVLAIDQSTQGTKGILLNDRAEIVAKAYLPHRQIVTPKGYISHDPNEIYKNVLGVAAKFQSDLSRIEIKVSEENELSALGVGFMAGIRAGLFSDDAAFGKRGYRSFTPKMSDGERKTRLSDWKRAVEAVTKGSI